MQGEGLKKLQSGQPISTRELLLLIAQLSWPAILAQISSVVMQYIDTAMVGQLGSNASAAIGVVATTSWLFGDLCIALTIGFNNAVLAEAFIERIRRMNRSMGIPEQLAMLRKEDVPELAARALKEGNPNYPVPVIWEEEQMRAFLMEQVPK